MKKHFYTIVTAAAIIAIMQSPLQGMAKGGVVTTKGEYLYNHRAYSEAIDYYQKEVKKAPKKKNPVLHAHLADCYRELKMADSAAKWYGRAMEAPRGITNDMKFHYGEVLMTLQRYDEAAKWLRQYAAAVPGNRRAANMINGCEHAKAMMDNMPEGVAKFLSINTDGTDFGPAIDGDKLAFTSDDAILGDMKKDKWTGTNYYNIYKVTCTSNGDCGTDVQPVSEKLNSKFHDGTCVFSKDGKQMWFTRSSIEADVFGESSVADQNGTVHLDIMIAEDFDAATKRYKKIVPFAYNDKNSSTTHPALSPDGNTLIFASDIAGGEGGIDLYMCKKDDKGIWGKPVNLGKTINTEGEEMFPVFIDNKTISFASNGLAGLGGLDVFYSMWMDDEKKWGTPINAGIPVNSPYDDMSLTMYDDGRNGFFASNRPAAKKSDNIYHYLKQKVSLYVRVVDAATDAPVEGAAIAIESSKGNHSFSSDANGGIEENLYPQMKYDVKVDKGGYGAYSTTVSTMELAGLRDTMQLTVKLIGQAISYKATILDEATKQPIDNPLLVVTKEGSSESDTFNLEAGAQLSKMLEVNSVYHINSVKDQYYSDEKIVSTKNYLNGIRSIADTILMCKLSVGAICQVENIYYDYDKSDIRKDAFPALNKLLKLLREYPTMEVQLNSHTDCRGTDDYNMRLSTARANSVIRYMASKGIKMSRLKAHGFGSQNPVYKCENCQDCPEEHQQQNRRTEFQVLHM